MIPEIKLLIDVLEHDEWNPRTQAKFMAALVEQDFYVGAKTLNDPAFSARDRITRSPKALGFVDLKPVVEITPAGDDYITSSRPGEVLLRQLLKFQLPSPYHTLPKDSDYDFCVKPYLEIIRLVRHFGTLAFDELMLFGMQLTNFNKFDEVVDKIEKFRNDKALNKGNYHKFFFDCCSREIQQIYAAEIASGQTHIREANSQSTKNFVKTKKSNLRDYADACFRYLRSTELVNISQTGHSLSIPPDRIADVDFILNTVSREPVFVDDIKAYKTYLFAAMTPALYSDNENMLIAKIHTLNPTYSTDGLSITELKDAEYVLRAENKNQKLSEQVEEIKNYAVYDDIDRTYDGILNKEYYDNPLMLEWNTWRAMTMLDGGTIEGGFNFDDNGQPLSTAAGNMPDILCDYNSFDLLVEVTLQSGQKQYDNEGEPVARHVGKHKAKTGRKTYCLFVAPTINPATIAHFYALHQINISAYGGKSSIVPLELSVFRKMLQDSYNVNYTPSPANVQSFFESTDELVKSAADENDWYKNVCNNALSWLSPAN
jgi:hypothetical protein